MAHDATSNKNASSFFSRKVSLGFLLLAVLVAMLDGILLAPFLSTVDPAQMWPSVTAVRQHPLSL